MMLGALSGHSPSRVEISAQMTATTKQKGLVDTASHMSDSRKSNSRLSLTISYEQHVKVVVISHCCNELTDVVKSPRRQSIATEQATRIGSRCAGQL
jgi:hypothetical protein